jgi:hypothetical protein
MILGLSAIGLSACGPGEQPVNDGVAANTSSASSPSIAIEPLVATSASDQAASTPAAAAEQSLAADSQQITPVLHYPPDSAN